MKSKNIIYYLKKLRPFLLNNKKKSNSIIKRKIFTKIPGYRNLNRPVQKK
jgi:hypothetical protein